MILREYLKRIEDYENITQYFINTLSKSEKYKNISNKKDELLINIGKMIKELIQLQSIEEIKPKLVVYKYMDFDNKGYFYDYDCSALYPNDNNLYGIEEIDWKVLIDSEIEEKSVSKYGLSSVISSILFRMTWHGYDYTTVKRNQEMFWEKLEDIDDEIEDEIFEEGILDNKVVLTKEEIKEIEKKNEICVEFNMKEYQYLK